MSDKREQEEIFSKSVKAGRRTYFFDVRATKANDYYLTITESKKDFQEDGTPVFKKHKIYLYKEDFKNFSEALEELTNFVIKEKGSEVISSEKRTETKKSDFTEVDFDDLGDSTESDK